MPDSQRPPAREADGRPSSGPSADTRVDTNADTSADLGARDVPVHEDGIRLGQLLKLADLVESGADAKAVLQEGLVTVNGQAETRRGRQLQRGDLVRVGDDVVRLVHRPDGRR